MINLVEIIGNPTVTVTITKYVESLADYVIETKEIINPSFVLNGVLILFFLILTGNFLLRIMPGRR